MTVARASDSSSFLSLAKNLYSSDARFIFELLQNAEDNKYEEAKELGVESFVSFTIRPGKIIVECNEDGFTKENLQAICDVGSSSKSTSHGYIGEKGERHWHLNSQVTRHHCEEPEKQYLVDYRYSRGNRVF